jgi:hypothetical protein
MDMTGSSSLIVFILPVVAAVYLIAFGAMCSLVRAGKRPFRRDCLWDTLAALVTAPVAALCLNAFVPSQYRGLDGSPNPLLFIVTAPCLLGLLFGALYSYSRRFLTH